MNWSTPQMPTWARSCDSGMQSKPLLWGAGAPLSGCHFCFWICTFQGSWNQEPRINMPDYSVGKHGYNQQAKGWLTRINSILLVSTVQRETETMRNRFMEREEDTKIFCTLIHSQWNYSKNCSSNLWNRSQKTKHILGFTCVNAQVASEIWWALCVWDF